jgi:stage II sporulation protein M
MPDLSGFQKNINAPFLFMNNTRAVTVIFFAGLFSFSVLGILLYMVNIGIIGGLFALFQLLGIQPWPIFLAGVIPHGIFEIPALMIGSAMVLYMGVAIVTPQTGKSMGEVILELLADWTKIFIGIVVPLLAIAALIEAYITPTLLQNVMKSL